VIVRLGTMTLQRCQAVALDDSRSNPSIRLLIAVKLPDFIVTPLAQSTATSIFTPAMIGGIIGQGRPQKITFAYCEDYRIAVAQTAPPARNVIQQSLSLTSSSANRCACAPQLFDR